jgi:toxin ParE1/3/4
MLLTMPQAGRLRQEFRENLRSFAVENYVIFYRTVSDGIDILRVVHGRRDIRAIDVT